MKKIKLNAAIVLITASLALSRCGNSNSKSNSEHQNTDETAHNHGDHGHGSENRKVSENKGNIKGDLSQILENYFSLSSALAEDNASKAADSADKLTGSLKGFDKSKLEESDNKEFTEITESATENAEHIGQNKGNIHHQREHMVSLSEDIKDLIALVGTNQKLYEDFCPMADNEKGAIWISKQVQISNPYMGSSMPTCGKINREIN